MEIKKYRMETQHAKQLYKPENDETVKLSQQQAARRQVIMVAMWERMGQWFGNLWESTYGTVDDQTIQAWTSSLNRFSEMELAGAIRSCEDWDGRFPPTFPEFKALCMAARSAAKPNLTEQRIAKEKEPDNIIGHLAKHALSDVAKRELDKMRRIMAGEEVETLEQSYDNLGLARRWGPLAQG